MGKEKSPLAQGELQQYLYKSAMLISLIASS